LKNGRRKITFPILNTQAEKTVPSSGVLSNYSDDYYYDDDDDDNDESE
jgi:hypothetical protein